MLAIDSNNNLDREFTVQDKIRLKLNEYGEKRVAITVEELASNLKLPYTSVYQALHRLRSMNELELEKTPSEGGRERIVGIIIKKLEPSSRTYRRVADRAGRSGRVQHIRPQLSTVGPVETIEGIPLLPNTSVYLNKKVAIEEMRQRATEAGLDPSVIVFEPDPLGEEAVILLKSLTDLRDSYNLKVEELRQANFAREAELRNAEFYKGKLKEETQRELADYGRTN